MTDSYLHTAPLTVNNNYYEDTQSKQAHLSFQFYVRHTFFPEPTYVLKLLLMQTNKLLLGYDLSTINK